MTLQDDVGIPESSITIAAKESLARDDRGSTNLPAGPEWVQALVLRVWGGD